MITKTDIEKLASLSRMKLTEEEKDTFAKEIESILVYVDQIKEVSDTGMGANTLSRTDKIHFPHRDVLREDIALQDLNPDPSVLVKLAPESQDGYIKVKKILG